MSDTSGTNGSGAIGATAHGQRESGAPSASLTTTRNNSWVFGVGNDTTSPRRARWEPNQTMVHEFAAQRLDRHATGCSEDQPDARGGHERDDQRHGAGRAGTT